MEHVGELTYQTEDVHGFTPSPNILGNTLTHTGNNKQYTITGFTWMSATDEWGFKHVAIGEHGIELVRPLWHLRGERSNGYTRYEEWQDYDVYCTVEAEGLVEPTG